MILLGNLMITLASVLNLILQMLILILVAKVIISWLNPDPYNAIVRFIDSCTDPILSWIRRKLRMTVGRIDFSPIILLLLIAVIQGFVVASIHDYGVVIKNSAASAAR